MPNRCGYMPVIRLARVGEQKGEAEGFDGAFISCQLDIGLYEARTLVDIPVTGTLESAALFCATMGRRFSLLAVDEQNGEIQRDLLRLYGLERNLVSIIPIHLDANDLYPERTSEDAVFERVLAAAKLARERDCLVPLPTDADSRLTPETLGRALGERDAPTIVILDAADLNVGAFDPFEALVPLARAAGAWTHVDGAFGLWARASRRHRDKTSGIDLADSWATDAHKWLNTPKDIGVAVVRDRKAHQAAMGLAASYIVRAEDGARDAMDFTPDWTRRARGIPVYAVLRELGRDGVEALIDRCCDFAADLATGIGALEGAELVGGRPTLNQGIVRFRDPRPGATDADHDAFTLRMIAAINAEGTAFFSAGMWRGRRTMRISVVGARTTGEDIRLTLDAVGRVLKAERAALQAT